MVFIIILSSLFQQIQHCSVSRSKSVTCSSRLEKKLMTPKSNPKNHFETSLKLNFSGTATELLPLDQHTNSNNTF